MVALLMFVGNDFRSAHTSSLSHSRPQPEDIGVQPHPEGDVHVQLELPSSTFHLPSASLSASKHSKSITGAVRPGMERK